MQPGTRLLFNTCDKTIITILNFKISWGGGGGGGRRNCGWGGNSSPPPPAWNPGTCQKLEQVACAPPTSSTVSYDPHSHSPTLPHSHPPTLTPSHTHILPVERAPVERDPTGLTLVLLQRRVHQNHIKL